MTGAIIGLIGAVFGAVAALAGSALSDRRQMRQEDMRWRRDQRGAAYEGALRHLLRASHMRSRIGIFDTQVSSVGGFSQFSTSDEHQNEWFSELAEAQFWLHTLVSRCEPAQSVRLGDSARRLDETVSSMTARTSVENVNKVREALDDAIQAVSRCAQLYMSIDGASGSSSSNAPATMSPQAG